MKDQPGMTVENFKTRLQETVRLVAGGQTLKIGKDFHFELGLWFSIFRCACGSVSDSSTGFVKFPDFKPAAGFPPGFYSPYIITDTKRKKAAKERLKTGKPKSSSGSDYSDYIVNCGCRTCVWRFGRCLRRLPGIGPRSRMTSPPDILRGPFG